jgi:preprotein translocase subunit SecA
VSLEDDLMRVFGSNSIKSMMGRFGIPEDEAIDSKLVSRALEGAQEKIEGFHFDARKHTLQYDDVLNHQRKSIYEKRRKILFKDEAYFNELMDSLIAVKPELADLIKEKKEKYSEEAFRAIVSAMTLQVIDMLWMDHLDQMEHMRNSVNLRAYGQRDPLVEYKKEGLRMFKGMEGTMIHDLSLFIENIDSVIAAQQANQNHVAVQGSLDTSKIGRNDACPCGSGKKWKKCGELNTEEHQKLMAEKK